MSTLAALYLISVLVVIASHLWTDVLPKTPLEAVAFAIICAGGPVVLASLAIHMFRHEVRRIRRLLP